MKSHSFLLLSATTSAVAAICGLPSESIALPLFGASAGILVLCVAAADYGSRPRYARLATALATGKERLPFAA